MEVKYPYTITQFTVEQVEAILTAISEENCEMKKLEIYFINLSSVDASLLARAVNMLEEVQMYSTELTGQQTEAIFTAIIEGNCKMKKLDMSGNILSNVDAGLLASAVNSLEEVKMNFTKLTKDQVEAVLTQSLVNTSLRRLEIGTHRLMGRRLEIEDYRDSGLGLVRLELGWLDEDLVARATLAIGELRFYAQEG